MVGKVQERRELNEAWASRTAAYLEPHACGRHLLGRRKHSVAVELTEGTGRREQAVWRSGLGKEKVMLVGLLKNLRTNESKAF